MPRNVKGVIYLLHFDPPYKHAKHYLGWASDTSWVERLDQHKASTGAKLVRIAQEAGCTWRLARTWEGQDRNQERRWKKRGKSRMCPICRAEKLTQAVTADGLDGSLS